MCCARARIFSMFLFQSPNFALAQKRKILQIRDHLAIVGVNPELVKLINAGPAGIEPHCARFGLAKLRSIRLGNEKQSQAMNCSAQLFSSEIDSSRDISPLIAPADLQLAIVIPAEN